jgi:hypothetical protein
LPGEVDLSADTVTEKELQAEEESGNNVRGRTKRKRISIALRSSFEYRRRKTGKLKRTLKQYLTC